MINLGNLDPDWQFAARHGQASLAGIPDNNSMNDGHTPICPCCYQYIYKQTIPLTVNSKELEFLGFGFPLFYSFVKNCIVLLLLLICSYSAISLKKAYDSNYNWCYKHGSIHTHRLLGEALTSAPTCNTFMIQMTRIEQQMSQQEDILRIISFVLQLFFLIYMRDHITKLENYYDQRNTSLSDYSIMLKNMPKQTSIQMKLKEFFFRAFTKPHLIEQITLLPEYPYIQELQADRQKIINQLRPSYDLDALSEEHLINQQNLIKIEQAIKHQVDIEKEKGLRDQIECEKAILVFNSDQQKTEILQQFKKMNYAVLGPFFGIGGQKITIKQAPEPKQILWENVHVQKKQKFMLFLLGWGLSFITLVAVTIIFYFILQKKSLNLVEAIQRYETNNKLDTYEAQYYGAVALVYILLILVMVFNKIIMASLFHKFTNMQRPQTRSKFQFSFGFKYLLGLFFTTALMTLAAQAIKFHNYYSHPYGVIQQQSIMFFLNAFFTPLFWLINPFLITKYLIKYLKFGKKGLTQTQANLIMQKPHYNIGKRYAEIIQTVWFTFLYSTLIPMGAIISLLGVCLYYWVDKYTLLRRSSIGGEVSGKMVIPYMKLLDFTLILKPIGQLMFDLQIRHNSDQSHSIIMIAIAFVYLILPMNRIIVLFNPQMFKLEQKTYQQVKQQFKDTYHSQHPIYKMIAADKLYNKLMAKGLTFTHSINTTENLIQNNTLTDENMPTNVRKKPSLELQKVVQDRVNVKNFQPSTLLHNKSANFSPRKRQHNPNY